jgi:hypothetical protein
MAPVATFRPPAGLTFPSIAVPLEASQIPRMAQLLAGYLGMRRIAALDQPAAERAIGSTLPDFSEPLLPCRLVDERGFTHMARALAQHLQEQSRTPIGHVHARCALAHALGYQSIQAFQEVLKGERGPKVVRSAPVRIFLVPAAHHGEVGGEIVGRRRRPRHPLWQLALSDERSGLCMARFYPEQPDACTILHLVPPLLVLNGALPSQVLLPVSTRMAYPELAHVLSESGIRIDTPPRRGQVRPGNLLTDFLHYLHSDLETCRESMASCEEIRLAAEHPGGVIVLPLHRRGLCDLRALHIARHLAETITRHRGRDPRVGAGLRKQETRSAPLNKGGSVPPLQDALTALLTTDRERIALQGLEEAARHLRTIRNAEPVDRPFLLTVLGGILVHRALDRWISGHDTTLSSFDFPDPTLQRWIAEGVQAVMRRKIAMPAFQFHPAGIFQAAAARVVPHYPPGTPPPFLHAVPGHHHLDALLLQRMKAGPRGRVATLPDLRPRPTLSHVFDGYRSPLHAWLRPFRTPFNPKQCLRESPNGRDAAGDHPYLVAIARFEPDGPASLPFEDAELAAQMTAFVNERLGRTGSGVTCTVEPFVPYGDVMQIDPEKPFGY